MNTENCSMCDKVFENMKGKYIIVVNEPKGSPCPAPVKIMELNNSMEALVMTNSTYIGQTDKPIYISAQYAINLTSQSKYIEINPNEFTHIEVDYDYYMYKNRLCVEKVILKKIKHLENSYNN